MSTLRADKQLQLAAPLSSSANSSRPSANTAIMIDDTAASSTTTNQRLPFGTNFIVQLQEGEEWDTNFLGELVYADFRNFDDLFNYILAALNLDPAVTSCSPLSAGSNEVELNVAYDVSAPAALKFLKGLKSVRSYVWDQKSWDGVVFAAQTACAPGEFYGIQLKVWQKEKDDEAAASRPDPPPTPASRGKGAVGHGSSNTIMVTRAGQNTWSGFSK